MQEILVGNASELIIAELQKRKIGKYLVVCCDRNLTTPLYEGLKGFSALPIPFTDFSSNPKWQEVVKGIELYNSERCEAIISIGGGSAIDVAKCIKLYAKSAPNVSAIPKEHNNTEIIHVSVPTTAGTGSESTKYAAVYLNGEKQSVHSELIIPEIAILDAGELASLPLYQRKCTLLDALCQAIESYWSVSSTDESRSLSKQAIFGIMKNKDKYLSASDFETDLEILRASNLAGRAINITATTACHAMSYKLTSLYGFPHGHSVALTLAEVFEYMEKSDTVSDKRGIEFLRLRLRELSGMLGAIDSLDAAEKFREMLKNMEMAKPTITPEQLEILVDSVNVERLSNNPVALDREALKAIYLSISE